MVIEEPFPDLPDGQIRLGGEHDGDRPAEPVEGAGPLGLLAGWWRGVGQGLADHAPVHPVAGGDGADRVAVLRVTADRGEQGWFVGGPDPAPPGPGGLLCLGGGPGVPSKCGGGAFEDGEGPSGRGGEPTGPDGPEVAWRPGEVAAQVAGPQVVGEGEPPELGLTWLAGGRPGADRERAELACGTAAVHRVPPGWGRAVCEAMSTWIASRSLRVIFSVPSVTAWIAALRISQCRLPIIPCVRRCR